MSGHARLANICLHVLVNVGLLGSQHPSFLPSFLPHHRDDFFSHNLQPNVRGQGTRKVLQRRLQTWQTEGHSNGIAASANFIQRRASCQSTANYAQSPATLAAESVSYDAHRPHISQVRYITPTNPQRNTVINDGTPHPQRAMSWKDDQPCMGIVAV